MKKLFLFALAAAGGVLWWQRRNETPPTPPALRAAEPFMDPMAERTVGSAAASPVTTPASGVDAPSTGTAAPSSAMDLPQPPRTPFASTPDGPADDLKRISGIGPKLERMLNEQGITTFRQLADLSDTDIDALQARLTQFPGRIRRDNWVEQAGRLAGS